ncbi:MAG: bifunctional phosphoribosylaminoimidazolecarboxamide formyltransferase/IMP cyclohydrolase [Phycisphaerales bacterium]
MPGLVPITRALLSVSDKTDLIPFARALAARLVEIVSTGGTAKALAEAGVPVTPIDRLTGFPEIMDGRVKTLHPKVHGGLLGLRDHPEHQVAMREHGIVPIDLVCINLYPFERTIARPGVSHTEAVEQIDIGGPSMIRSGAKNFEWVTVVTSPNAYDRVVGELDANDGKTSRALRAELAAAAFGRTSEYDAAIASFLGRASPAAFPQVLRLGYIKAEELRYGENPHQQAALYRDPSSTGPTIVNARKLHGKDLSYNNINDAAAALELVKALTRLDRDRAGAAVIKHTIPCGAALADPGPGDARRAIELALAGDPQAAYGGILAVNTTLDASAAERLSQSDVFLEVLVAPDFEPVALDMLTRRWANLRILAVGERQPSALRKIEYRSVPGGMLVQDRDLLPPEPQSWTHAAGPRADRHTEAAFLEIVVRFLLSNAIAIGGRCEGGIRLFGAGAGQVDRVSACRLAVAKAGSLAKGAVAASDAFFPFADGPTILADAGVSMIVHPGGSKRDQETFDLCNARNIACYTTGIRHFRH